MSVPHESLLMLTSTTTMTMQLQVLQQVVVVVRLQRVAAVLNDARQVVVVCDQWRQVRQRCLVEVRVAVVVGQTLLSKKSHE
jgi:hypothetical protein